MVGYLDSSVLLQNLLEDDQGLKHALTCDYVISSELINIECCRIIHRYRLEGQLNESDFLRSLMRLEESLEEISMIKLVDEIKQRAAEAFPTIIKTLDALHLSSAIAYQKRLHDEKIIVFSYDRQFNRCARALGFVTPFLSEAE